MKSIQLILSGILSCTCALLTAQLTPEQQKQAEEAQAKAMEIMQNNPQFEEARKMMEAAEAQMRQEKMQKQLEEEKGQMDTSKDRMTEFYWRNKVASDNRGKFSDWSWGEVEIAYYTGKGRQDLDYVVTGIIGGDGQVKLSLPQKVSYDRTIDLGLFPQMHEITNDQVSFSNPKAPFLWSGYTFAVLREGKKIGTLYIGNSERATHNLASPTQMKYGDTGYLLYWANSSEACHATYSKDALKVAISEGEESKRVDRYTRVDLDFKPGWNLVKIEVNGAHLIGNSTRWKWKTYSIISEMPSDARYYFRYDD